MQVCGGVIVKHTPLRLTQGFKISLNPLIVPQTLRLVSERGVNSELIPVTGNKDQMILHVKELRFNDPLTLFHKKL